MKIYSIGFTGKNAEEFFTLIKGSRATKLIDIRINRNSQLAGFAKERDLEYFLEKLSGVKYLVDEDLAPTKELLSFYRDKAIDWNDYSKKYLDLIIGRDILNRFDENYFSDAVLLCSENFPDQCHRLLLCNYLQQNLQNVEVVHLA